MQKIISILKTHLYFPVTLMLVSVLLRMYEMCALVFFSSSGAVPLGNVVHGLFADWLFIAFVSLCFFPAFVLMNFIHKKTAIVITYCISLLYIVLQTLFVEYFRTMLYPLDSVIFSYKPAELLSIVQLSATGNFAVLAAIALCMLGSFAVIYQLLAHKFQIFEKFSIFNLCTLIFIMCAASWHIFRPRYQKFDNEFRFFVTVNKVEYFTSSVFTHFSDKKEFNSNETGVALKDFQNDNPHKEFMSLNFPLLHRNTNTDVLGEFFTFGEQRPNIVVIIFEGLGSAVSGTHATLSLTPFVDSLAAQSLSWSNFLSNSGRTFGVLANIFGSLPFGENGFTFISPQMPQHQSLISILKENGYRANFFHGGLTWCDNIADFMRQNNVDVLLDDANFDTTKYRRIARIEGSDFSWGYHDGDMFTESFSYISKSTQPRLDMYLTITTHSPWFVPNKEETQKAMFQSLAKKGIVAGTPQYEILQKNKDAATCYFYADQSVRNYFTEAQKQAWFNNTIFIITGDHRQDLFSPESEIEQYHVPFIVYSPMLKRAEQFASVSSHLDITPTLLGMLHANFGIETPEYVHWLGSEIDTARDFRNIHNIPFMNSNRSISEFLSGMYFLKNNTLFEISDGMRTQRIQNDEIQYEIARKLNNFKQVNSYVTKHNKIVVSD
ncbi:MAG: sulfatase-like hydrolase/transferase [Bacteroidetes bacterium]|nr:sulfatase-like hydrolase/transferase [Bacteroidota bacterium]